MYKHTIFTPVYNRADMLDGCYQSICELRYPKEDFEWLIVDDGSTDDLKKHVEQYLREGRINIRYFYKENGGIHTAMNFAIKNACGGGYITRIDSDDFLLPNALSDMDRWLAKPISCPEDRFIGVVGCCINESDGMIRGTRFPFEYEDSTGHDIRVKYHASGDRSFCMKTDVMKQYLIPEYLDTKYVPEGIIWNRIDKDGYITRFVSTPFSKTREHARDSMLDQLSNVKKNQGGMRTAYYSAYHSLIETYDWLSKKERIKQCLVYLVLGKTAGKHKSFFQACTRLQGKARVLSFLTIPIAYVMQYKYR